MGTQPGPDTVREDDGGNEFAGVDFRETQSSPEFKELRKTHRSFVFPMTVVFIVWYFVYVILAAFAPDFMAISVWGNVNVGIIFGLLQFVSTFVITAAYVRFANRKLDPQAQAIRERLENSVAGGHQ
ncbi:DUF485 domain-containing protein [Zhihengliuella flava]|uniref:Uncharacterized membrane protein (DUF485 family) n=1 Tax=Zhihengliuella flava TaxID=1285193 RepID=A0A931GE99_9MICC|nr:DUF485 domain-containing protein [Zhihengliuella flava]MBG6083855.1 uncharacterized membrane protein (DUF485 family) [Zhihengliuella flava]